MIDPIERQAAIDAVDPETASTNPEHFKLNANEKFIKFMDDADIASFGEWQWANGFNTAVVAAKRQLEKLPSAQPEIIQCKDCKHWDKTWTNGWAEGYHYCPMVDGIRKVDFYCADAERRTNDKR